VLAPHYYGGEIAGIDTERRDYNTVTLRIAYATVNVLFRLCGLFAMYFRLSLSVNCFFAFDFKSIHVFTDVNKDSYVMSTGLIIRYTVTIENPLAYINILSAAT